ncbi:hypothetical protein FRB99_007541, partial [Tulasnella sp. 403]
MAGPHSKKRTPHGNNKFYRATRTRARRRDLDQIQLVDLDPKNRAKLEKQPIDVDLPGLGQHYCVECARYFESDLALNSHWKTKVHKKRVRMLKEPAYTVEEAEREVCGVDEEMEAVYEDAGVVLVLERAEKLKETASLQPLLVPLIRLGELARFSVTTIFISSTPWSDLKPLGMNTPDPFTVRLSLQPKQVVIGELDSQYPNESPSVAYHRNLRPLYSAFLSVLYDSCNLYTNDPHEIAFMAHTMWPVFIRPLLEEWKFNHEENGAEDYKLPAKASDVLIPRFRLSFSRSFPPLHARTISARAFLKSCASAPSPRLSQLVNGAKDLPTLHDASKAIVSQQGGDLDALLSRRKKLMLVAAYIASFNPPRTDLRMFGRVAEGSSKKGRRRGGGGGSTANRKKTKTLLGPNSFALERFIAIYGSLVTEHGDENLDMEDLRPGELEVEVHRAGILMA